MIEEKYNKWVNHPNIDPALKAELLAMDEKQKVDAFYTNIEFGTAGMRGLLGAGTNRINYIRSVRQIPVLLNISRLMVKRQCSAG